MIDTKEWLSRVNAGIGQTLKLVFHRDQSWDLLCFTRRDNDLPEEITSNAKLFAGDASLFSVATILRCHQFCLRMTY